MNELEKLKELQKSELDHKRATDLIETIITKGMELGFVKGSDDLICLETMAVNSVDRIVTQMRAKRL